MTIDSAWVNRWMDASQERIALEREYLIELDREIGDGDHGENLDRGFTAVKKALSNGQQLATSETLRIVAKTLMSTVGGASGPLLGTAFLYAAQVATDGELNGQDIANMMEALLSGIQVRGKAEEGEKTMVDAWAPAARSAKIAADNGGSAADVLNAAALAAEQGALATQPMKATKGRASYLGDRSIGHLDPGAASSAMILSEAAKMANL